MTRELPISTESPSLETLHPRHVMSEKHVWWQAILRCKGRANIEIVNLRRRFIEIVTYNGVDD
jgi:hypothetical protein